MLRLLRSPRWLVGHVVVLVTVVAFVNLGAWQLRRLDERRTYNALVSERMVEEPVPVGELVGMDPEAAAYRRATATGTYRTDQEVLLSTRSHEGRPGHHVLTPLDTGEQVLLVDRGWVPLDMDDPPVAEAAPPSGQVTVEGVLFPSAEARRAGTLDGGPGPLEFVSEVDVPVVADATSLPLLPLWLLAAEQEPAQGGALPLFADPPELAEGNHLSYAAQWFLFALVVALGYPMLLRRAYRDTRDAAGEPLPEAAGPREPPVPAR